ncbi:MAG: DNA recombination protein RmuC [Candidatus Brennerbacteria bacterium]
MNLSEILLAVLALVFAGGFYAIWKMIQEQKKPDDAQSLVLIQNQMNEITRTLDMKLGESTRAIREQFGESAKIIKDVTENLTRLQETNKQVVGFADQLKSLQDILKNPKQRGILGEYYLETVLKNVLPPGSYEMQYPLGIDEKTGKDLIVDAIVKVDKRIIPVDSKFSLENYNRILEAHDPAERKRYEAAFVQDLKNRIDETSKYVKPEEGTMDFAFMFIPSEAVYYDLLINKVGAVTDDTNTLITYAGTKKVIIVSPTSFLAYLQTVLQGLRYQKISEQANEIIGQVEKLGKHLLAYQEHIGKVGKNLGITVSSYNKASKELGKIDKDVLRITGDAAGIKPMEIESPRDVAEVGEEE